MRKYKIFLSHNFASYTLFLVEKIRQVCTDLSVELILCPPGGAARGPADYILGQLETTEGLLVVVREDTSWVSNEIGMAFALGLPIYIIAPEGTQVRGLPGYVTSIGEANILAPAQLRPALSAGIERLLEEAEKKRDELPERPHTGDYVESFSWNRYYELILKAYDEIIQADVGPGQGGYKPTIVLGLSRGGIIAADILARRGRDLPIGLVGANRVARTGRIIINVKPLKAILDEHCSRQTTLNEEVRILIVDDVIKSGNSLEAAVLEVRKACQVIENRGNDWWYVKTLVLISQGDPHKKKIVPDYHMTRVPEEVSILLPYGRG